MQKCFLSLRVVLLSMFCGLAVVAALVVHPGTAQAAADPILNTVWHGYNGFEYTINASGNIVITDNSVNPTCVPLGWVSFFDVKYQGPAPDGGRLYTMYQIPGCQGYTGSSQLVTVELSSNGQGLGNGQYIAFTRVSAVVASYVACSKNATGTVVTCQYPSNSFNLLSGPNAYSYPNHPTLADERCTTTFLGTSIRGKVTCVGTSLL